MALYATVMAANIIAHFQTWMKDKENKSTIRESW